jgi:hypothetical protein
LFDHSSHIAIARGALVESHVGLSDDAHAASLVIYYRHAANLLLRHDPLYGFDTVIGTAAFRVSRQDLTDRCFRTLTLRGAAAGDIPVRYNTNEAIGFFIFDDRDTPAVVFPHELRRLHNGLLRGAAGGLRCHQFTRFHPVLLMSGVLGLDALTPDVQVWTGVPVVFASSSPASDRKLPSPPDREEAEL